MIDIGMIDEDLCARLAGDQVPMSAAMIAAARRHRMHLVLAAAARRQELEDPIAAPLRDELRTAAAVNIVRERLLRDLVDRFAREAVDLLLIKGAGLAYTAYQAAHLRPRADLDVMISRATLDRAERALGAGGWMRAPEPDGELATSQRHYVWNAAGTFAEPVDVHWKVAIPQLFAEAVTFEELLTRAVPIAALGPHARTLSPPDALFVACVHRVAHHADAVDLLWLWDIHLLASRLSDDERACFTTLAARASMRAVSARGLELAAAHFRTPVAAELVAALQSAECEPPEPSVSFLGGGLRQVDLLRSDLAKLRGWRARLALVTEHMFPSAAYMRATYPGVPAALLPITYLIRIVRGAPQWFRRAS